MNFCRKIAMLLAVITLVTCFATLSASAETVEMGAPLAEYFMDVKLDFTYDKPTHYDQTTKKTDQGVGYAYITSDTAGALEGAPYIVTNVNNGKQGFLQPGGYPNAAYKNAVVEFDMAFVELPTSGHMQLQFTGPTPSNSRVFSDMIRVVVKDGKINLNNSNKSGTGASNVNWALGKWKSFYLTIDTINDVYDMYVKDRDDVNGGYTHLGQYPLAGDYTQCLNELRFDSRFNGGVVAYDNIALYEGTEKRDFRTVNSSSSNTVKFKFMAAYLNSNDLSDQSYAYLNMQNLLLNITDAEINADADLKAAVNAFNAFDYNSIQAQVKALNQATLNGYVNDLKAVPRKLDNVNERVAKLSVVEQFMGKNVFDTLADDYKAAQTAVTDAQAAIDKDYVIMDFMEVMRKFGRINALETMQNYYAQAKALVDGGLDVAVLSDSNLKANYTSFQTSYNEYIAAAKKIQDAVNEKNSERFVAHMSHLAGYNGYNTVQTWEENYDEFQMYMTYSRGVLASGEYNSKYIGFAEAMVIYNTLNDYFYDAYQKDHAKEIESYLNEYATTNSYVTKFGICHAVNKYIVENDVDKKHDAIVPLLRQLAVYEGELEILEEAYIEEVESNTTYFVGYAKQMEANRGYNALKQIYNKAIVYYHNINADTEEAIRALDIFDSCGEYLESVEYDSRELIAAAAGIGEKSGDELYLALVKCYEHASNVSEDIAGVSAALDAYEAAYAAYTANVATINAELRDCGAVGCAVYMSPAARAAIKVIHKIF